MHEIRPSIPATDAPPRRLTPRVYAERPGSATKVLVYRLAKALEAGDKDAAAAIWKSLSPEERAEIRDGDDLVKGFWNPRTRKYDLPAPDDRGLFSRLHPRPAQEPEPVAPKRPSLTLAPQTGTGFRHAVQRGQIIHAVIDGVLHHFKVYKWGSQGVTGINRDGDVAAITWSDVRWGVAPEAMAEHVAKSVTLDLYAMTPEQRAAYFALRDGGDL